MEKKTRKSVMFRCDEDVWKSAEKILEGTGISRARYIELMLRGLVQSKSMTVKDVMGNVVDGLFETSIIPNTKLVKRSKKKKK